MAEIKIRKKRPVWPWVVLVIILALAVFFYWFYSDYGTEDSTMSVPVEEERVDIEPGFEEEVAQNPDENAELESAEYLSYIKDKARMGTEEEYTRNALVQLFNAVKAKARFLGLEESPELRKFESEIQARSSQPQSATALSVLIKEDGSSVVTILDSFREARYPALRGKIGDLRNSLEAIDPVLPFDEQKEAVIDFFDAAAEVIKNMN